MWCRHVTTYDTLWSSECVVLLRTVIFADEYFRDGICLAATEMLVCETSGRDDRASSCNHDIDLVIGKALVFC